jgi:CheY-like chemotaxis protein
MTPTLLIVDDEKTTREGLRAALEDRTMCTWPTTRKRRLTCWRKKSFDVLLTDFRLPTEDGMKLISRAKSLPRSAHLHPHDGLRFGRAGGGSDEARGGRLHCEGAASDR